MTGKKTEKVGGKYFKKKKNGKNVDTQKKTQATGELLITTPHEAAATARGGSTALKRETPKFAFW